MKLRYYFLAILLIVSIVNVSAEDTFAKSELSNLTYSKSEIDCRVLYLNGKILDTQSIKIGDVRYNVEKEQLEFYDGAEWVVVPGSKSVDVKATKNSKKDVDEEETTSADVVVEDSAKEEENVSLESSEEKDTCSEICEDECSTEEQCEDVEVCEEVCDTVGEEEVCEDECSAEEQCEDVEVCSEVCHEECGRPEQLFDIRMDLEDVSIETAGDLVAVVTYESFGSIPTPVNLKFEIFDTEGNLVYSEDGYIIVEVEEVGRYNFPNLDLPYGDYEFVFTTLYNVDVQDEFRQNFSIKKEDFLKRIWGWIFG